MQHGDLRNVTMWLIRSRPEVVARLIAFLNIDDLLENSMRHTVTAWYIATSL